MSKKVPPIDWQNVYLPSPEEIHAAASYHGPMGEAWTAKTLARWGVSWPPKAGWRAELEARWRAQGEPSSGGVPKEEEPMEPLQPSLPFPSLPSSA